MSRRWSNRGGRPKGVALDGDRLRSRRLELGLTQVELGELAALTDRTVRDAEGRARISLPSARRLSSALGIPFVALLRPSRETVRHRLIERGYAPTPPPSPWASREDQARQALDILGAGDDAAVCCLAGPSGIGKTALARWVAAELDADFPDGVIWIRVPRLGEGGRLLHIQLDVAQALGFDQRLPNPGLVDPAAFDRAFCRLLWSRRRLLILDDVEPPQLVRRFTEGANGGILVTTARRVVAEQPIGSVVELGPLDDEAALDLLATFTGQRRVEAERDGALRLIHVLDGVPRSLQIAGRVLQREEFTRFEDYAAQLAELSAVTPDIDAGTGSPADDPDTSFAGAQHQLQRRLSEESWRVFGALGVFEDARFSAPWAIAVAGISAGRARRSLSELTDLYLLQQVPPVPPADPTGGTDDGPWFQLDAQAQRMARWRAGSETAEAEGRLLAFAAQEAARLSKLEPHALVARVLRQMPVWRLCLNAGRSMLDEPNFAHGAGLHPGALPDVRIDDPARARLIPAILRSLQPFFAMRASVEACEWLFAGIAVARHLGILETAAELMELMAGSLWLTTVDFETVASWQDAAGDAYRQCGRHEDAAGMHLIRAELEWMGRGSAAAIAAHEDALSFCLTAPVSSLRLACARSNLAGVLFNAGDADDHWTRADDLLTEAASLNPGDDEVGPVVGAIARLNLAAVRLARGGRLPDGIGAALVIARQVNRFDEIALLRVDELSRVLGVSNTNASEPSPDHEALFWSVPPELLNRRISLIWQLAITELVLEDAVPPELAQATGAPPVPTPVGAMTLVDVAFWSPLILELGNGLAMIYPSRFDRALLDSTGLPLALQFIEETCGVEHPVYAMLTLLTGVRARRN